MAQQSSEGSVQSPMETHYLVSKLKINYLHFQEDLIGSYFDYQIITPIRMYYVKFHGRYGIHLLRC